MDVASTSIEAAGRWLVYVTVLPVFGLLAWRLLLWPRIRGATSRTSQQIALDRAALDRALAVRGVLCSTALLVALAFRATCQSANVHGIAAAFDLESLRTVAIESRWGGRFLVQVWAAAGALAAFAWARLVHARSGWLFATLAVCGLGLALPRTGHAMSHGVVALAAQSLHVLGAGLWVGTLSVLVTGTKPWGIGASTTWDETETAETLRRFAPLAITGVAALFASGALNAYLFLPSLASVPATPWGRTLLLKVAVVAVVGFLGLLNFRRFRRPKTAGSPSRSPLLLARVELALALFVVTLTAVLTSLPSPGD